MAYSFDRDETIRDGLRRNAASQIDEALHDLEHPEARGLVESVHDARKRCKKLRGLARLVRPAIGDLYERTNVAFRDAARELSDVRDTQVRLETFDRLLASAPEGMRLPDLAATRREIRERHRAAGERLARDGARLEAARELVREGRALVNAWDVADDFDALAGGIARTYGRAHKRHRKCRKRPTVEAFHEWRKRAKYHWYHVRMLTDAAPELLEPWANRLHDLSDLLGDDHDLAELCRALRAEPDAFGGDDAVDTVAVLAEGRSAGLRRRALSLGARLCEEKTDAVVGRLRCYWEAWKEHGPAPEATELADLATDDALSELSRDELAERAAARDVKGRSRMTRRELEPAVRATGVRAHRSDSS